MCVTGEYVCMCVCVLRGGGGEEWLSVFVCVCARPNKHKCLKLSENGSIMYIHSVIPAAHACVH